MFSFHSTSMPGQLWNRYLSKRREISFRNVMYKIGKDTIYEIQLTEKERTGCWTLLGFFLSHHSLGHVWSSVLSGQTRALACFNIWDISNFYLKWFDHQQFTVLKQNLLTSSLHGLGQDPGQEEVLEVTTSQRRFLPNPATSTAGEAPFILPLLTLSEAATASNLPLMIRRLPPCPIHYRDPGRFQRHL